MKSDKDPPDTRESSPTKRDDQQNDRSASPAVPEREEGHVLDPVEEADEESFPASDPPGWIPLHPGPPKSRGGVS